MKIPPSIAAAVSIPVIANGGAGSVQDLGTAVKTGKADACAAGSLFVFQKKDMGVLVNFPSHEALSKVFT